MSTHLACHLLALSWPTGEASRPACPRSCRTCHHRPDTRERPSPFIPRLGGHGFSVTDSAEYSSRALESAETDETTMPFRDPLIPPGKHHCEWALSTAFPPRTAARTTRGRTEPNRGAEPPRPETNRGAGQASGKHLDRGTCPEPRPRSGLGRAGPGRPPEVRRVVPRGKLALGSGSV